MIFVLYKGSIGVNGGGVLETRCYPVASGYCAGSRSLSWAPFRDAGRFQRGDTVQPGFHIVILNSGCHD